MDEFDQKISSRNVFLQSQAVTTLHGRVVEKAKDGCSVYELPETKKLWNVANSGEVREATLAVETLISLVRLGHLPAPATLQNFLADVASAKSPTSLVRGITQLILLLCEVESNQNDSKNDTLNCPFTGPPSGPMHPYVLLINKRPDFSWPVLEEASFLLQHSDPRVQRNSIKILHPLLLHTFCLTESSGIITRPLLSLLITTHEVLPNAGLIDIFCKIVILIKHTSKDHLERKVTILNALTTMALSSNDMALQAALLPCLVLSIPQALQHGVNTRTLESNINTLALQLGRGCDVTISALAEALPLTSGTTQVHLLRLGATLLSCKDGNPLVGARLLPSLLQVLSAPCTSVPGLTAAAATLISIVQATPAQISSNLQLSGNVYWDKLQCTYSNLASFAPAVSFCNLIIKDPQLATDWLEKLASTANLISGFHHTIVTSVFLYQGSSLQSVQEAAKVLEREVVKEKTLSIELFPMVLYRLGREKDPNTRLTLLYVLPSLAVNKLCVALVLKTLLALWSSNALRPLILRLLYEVWTVEPRVFPYLTQLINDKTVDTLEVQISRAYIVASICKLKPSQHGEELLPLLSGILNECRGEDGTAQTMIALSGIYDLCAEAIIDLRTTWRVIAPKLVRDKRPEVLIKLCELLGLAPNFESRITSTEYEAFIGNILTVLWNWATFHSNLKVVEAAYKALEKFKYLSYRLKMLPQYLRQGHKLPINLATNPFEAARNPEDVLEYVPGLAWIKLVTGCPKSHVEFVMSFAKSLVAREVSALPKGIYLTAVQEAKKRGFKGSGGKPEPSSYSFLPDSSVLKSFIHYLLDFSKVMIETDDQDKSERLLQATDIILSALGQTLNRPYPALDWVFLSEVLGASDGWGIGMSGIDWSSKIRHRIFYITAQQSNKSASASVLITKWLNLSIADGITKEDELVMFNVFDSIGRGIPPTILQPFLSHIFLTHIDDNDHMKDLLDAIKPHLTADLMHDTNRNILSNAIENLNEKMNPSNEIVYSSYKSCVADLPMKHIERLTSPSLWWEVTDERLYRAAVLRCHVASNDPEENALPWLNDLVDSAASLPGDRAHLLLVMADTLVKRSSITESTTWLLQLLGRLRDHLKKQFDDNLVAAHEQQQRVIFYTDLLVISLLIWSGLWATSTLEKLASNPLLMDTLIPSALISLSGRTGWKETLSQILNWMVLTHATLIPYTKGRYQMKNLILFLSIICPDLTQRMWNKIVAIHV